MDDVQRWRGVEEQLFPYQVEGRVNQLCIFRWQLGKNLSKLKLGISIDTDIPRLEIYPRNIQIHNILAWENILNLVRECFKLQKKLENEPIV